MLRLNSKEAIVGFAILLLCPLRADAQVVGVPQATEQFGHAVAMGDFNGDSYADLAVGVPFDFLKGPADQTGSVNVIYGSATGLNTANNARWRQGVDGILGDAEFNDAFGWSVATGDFNGDTYDDLAIGAPYEDIDGVLFAGSVNVLYGSDTGLQAASNQIWQISDFGLVAEGFDEFGWSLAAGDFDNDTFDDVAIGVHKRMVSNEIGAGLVMIMYGTASGLETTDSQSWTQPNTGTGTPGENDLFGYSLAVGNFDGDSYADLAIGIESEDIGSNEQAGAVAVIYGTNTGLSAAGSQLWHQDSAGIEGEADPADHFGSSLAVGDFDNDTFDDLAIGVPEEDIGVGGTFDTGAVNVIYGASGGLTTTDNQYFTEDTGGIPGAAEEYDWFGYALTSGNFDKDNNDDLAISLIGQAGTGPGSDSGGAVVVLAGAPGGLDTSLETPSFIQDDPGIEGEGDPDGRWGSALAAGDFNNDGEDDLVVGAPDERVESAIRAGLVHILYGVFAGLDSSQLWHQGANPVVNESEVPGLPRDYALLHAYPNPFNPSATVRYDVSDVGHVRLTVFDSLGRSVGVLVDDEHTPGHHSVAFNADDLPSGVYLIRMEAGSTTRSQRVTLLR